jgi:hypothetical protein
MDLPLTLLEINHGVGNETAMTPTGTCTNPCCISVVFTIDICIFHCTMDVAFWFLRNSNGDKLMTVHWNGSTDLFDLYTFCEMYLILSVLNYKTLPIASKCNIVFWVFHFQVVPTEIAISYKGSSVYPPR